MSDDWEADKEDGLPAPQVVALGKAIQGKPISLEWDGSGFTATVGAETWGPYGLLSEMLEDLGAPEFRLNRVRRVHL